MRPSEQGLADDLPGPGRVAGMDATGPGMGTAKHQAPERVAVTNR